MKGVPDIIIVKKGQFIGLEVKRPGTYQSPEQKTFECELTDAGGQYHVVRSIDDVQQIRALSQPLARNIATHSAFP